MSTVSRFTLSPLRTSLLVSFVLLGACGSSVDGPAWRSGAGGQAGAAGGSGGSSSGGGGQAGGGEAGTGLGGAAGHTGGGAGTGGKGGTAGAGGSVHGDPYLPPPEVVAVPQSSIQQVESKIDAALASSSSPSSGQGVLVVDEQTGQVIYQKNPDKPLVPASNTKLFTSGVAFAKWGRDGVFVTDIVASSTPDNTGTIQGDLHFIVHHDFSWSTYFYDDPSFPLKQLASDLYDLGLRNVHGDIVLHGEALYEGYRFGTYDANTERTKAASKLRSALIAEGIASSGVKTTASFDLPAGAASISSWSSIPLSVACYPLNNISHNEFADILSRHVGYESTGTSSYAAGTSQTLSWLASLGVDTSGAELHDGSGLSHSNHVTPRQVVSLIEKMDTMPDGQAWEHTFSVAGVTGTLRNRMTGADTVGRFLGKTGTLNGVISTSGYLEHRYLGRRFIISTMFNDVGNKTAARGAQDKIVEAVAADLLGKGDAPDAPVLQRAQNDGNGSTVTVSWSEVSGAEGYLIWVSEDGLVWSRSSARYVTSGHEHVIGELTPGQRLFVRVTARSADGLESAPSDTYGVVVDSQSSDVLVVDGDDRWQAQPTPENTLGGGHRFVVTTERAIEGRSYDTVANELVESGQVSLDDYRAVVWSLGEEGTADRTFTKDEQDKVSAYLNAGGGLFVSGSEVGYDLDGGNEAVDQAFYQGVLKAHYEADDAGTYVVRGKAGVFKNINRLRFYTPGGMVVGYPDKISVAGGSQEVLTYATGGTAAVQYDGNYRLVYMAFPFETIDNERDRKQVMSAVLGFLVK